MRFSTDNRQVSRGLLKVKRRHVGLTWVVLIVFVATIFTNLFTSQADAAITTRSGSTTTSYKGSTITINKPAGAVAGDLLVFYVYYNSASFSYGCTRGYTPIGNEPTLSETNGYAFTSKYFNSKSTLVYTRTVTVSDPASYTFSSTIMCILLGPTGSDETVATSITGVAGMSAFGGVDAVGNINNVDSTASTAIQAPSITTTYNNSTVLTFFGSEYDTTITPPGGISNVYTALYSGGGGASSKATLYAGLFTQATAGNTPIQTATAANSADNTGLQLELTDAASIPPTVKQANYRWFANADSPTPGSPLAAQDTAITTNTGTPVRLRQRFGVDTAQASANQMQYKLQYAQKVDTCDTSFSGESYSDLATQSSALSSKKTATVAVDMNDGWIPWSTPENATATDGINAVLTSSTPDVSSTIKLTGYGFEIPPDATIEGVQADLTHSADSGGYVDDYSVTLTKAGSADRQLYAGTQVANTYGGPTDLWGLSWTPADINSADFGINLQVEILNAAATYNLDSVALTVFYSARQSNGSVKYYDNTSVSNGATISITGSDPTNGTRPTVYQSYRENDYFTNNVASIPSGSDGLWDFAIIGDDTAAGKSYCIRTVKSDGTLLNSYSYIPEVTFSGSIAPPMAEVMRGGGGVRNGVKGKLSW